MKVRVVSRPEAAAAYALAGLDASRVGDEAAAAERIMRYAEDREVAMILVDEALYRALPRDLLTRLDRQAVPIVSSVPGPRWDERSEAEAYILAILQQAIGYRVRVR